MGSKGFSLIQTLVSLGIVGLLSYTAANMAQFSSKETTKISSTFSIDLFKQNAIAHLRSEAAWDATLDHPTNAANFDCLLDNDNSCATEPNANKKRKKRKFKNASAPRSFALVDASGSIVYDATNPSNGLTMDGKPCADYRASGNDACPVRLDLTWQPICSAPCTDPRQVRIQGKFRGKIRGLAFDSGNRDFTMIRETETAVGGGANGVAEVFYSTKLLNQQKQGNREYWCYTPSGGGRQPPNALKVMEEDFTTAGDGSRVTIWFTNSEASNSRMSKFNTYLVLDGTNISGAVNSHHGGANEDTNTPFIWSGTLQNAGAHRAEIWIDLEGNPPGGSQPFCGGQNYIEVTGTWGLMIRVE